MQKPKTLNITTKNNFTLTELEISRVKQALTKRDYSVLLPIYELMQGKDSHVASEVMRRRLAISGAYHECTADVILWDALDAVFDSILTGAAAFEVFSDAGVMTFEPLGAGMVQKDLEGYFLTTDKNERLNPLDDPRLYLCQNKTPALFSLIWIFCAKHFVISHYMKFTEFLGVPPIIVNTDSSDTGDIMLMADSVSTIGSGGVGIFGKEDVVTVLEGRGNQADFMEFIRYCDTQISLGLVGNTLSGNEGKSGSLAMSQTHQESFAAITMADARYVEKHINALLKRVGKKEDFKYLIEREKDLKTRAETLKILYDMGVVIPKDYIEKEFDLPTVKAAKAANSKESNSKALPVDAIDREALRVDTRPVERELADRLEAIFEKTGSYAGAQAALAAAYPDIEFKELETTLERLIANSYIQGSAEI